MLQTVLLLAILFGALVLGVWMAFFGHRAFRLSGALFGFCLGVSGTLFAAFQFNVAFDSILVMVGTPLLGLLLGLLGAFIPIAGAGLGGIAMGYFYGVGLVDIVNTLMNDSLDPILYTAISVLIIAVVFIVNLIWHNRAKWLTTAFAGSYAAAFAVVMVLTWFMAGGFNSTDPALAGSFLDTFNMLKYMLTSGMRMLMMGAALLIGILGSVIQVRSMKSREDYSLISRADREDDEFYDEEDTEEEPVAARRRGLFSKRRDEEDEDDLFPEEEEPVARKRKGLFAKQRDEDEDDFESFDEELAQPKSKRDSRVKKAKGFDDEPALYDEDSGRDTKRPEAKPVQRAQVPHRSPQPQVAAVQPVEPRIVPKDATQVFRRVQNGNATQSTQDARAVQPESRKPESQPEKTTAGGAIGAPRMTPPPSFTPRSTRRK